MSELRRFYDWIGSQVERQGGYRYLADATGASGWPKRGVYFFFEPDCSRIVRVGTHALTFGSRSTLWGRLSQHRGSRRSGGGNHRGSIFRLLVGAALIRRGDHEGVPSWGLKSDIGKAATELKVDKSILKRAELPLERLVSDYIGRLPFVVVGIDDEPGPNSQRSVLERNSIALLSASSGPGTTAEPNWLGSYSDREKVQKSLLWNNNHVDGSPDPGFVAGLWEAGAND